MIRSFILRHVNDYTDSNGDIDTLGLIELVIAQFGCSPKNAEEYVYEALELE